MDSAKKGTIATTLAGRMLCASALAYSIPTKPSIINPPNANIPWTNPYFDGAGYMAPPMMIQNGLAACTIGQNPDGIILAFRGTVYNSIQDWIDDLLIAMKTGRNIPGRVHSGFYDDLVKIIQVVDTTLKSVMLANPGLSLIITGHSKGAGMAPIAASYLAANYNIRASQVCLFAPPLPGNAAFASAYNSRFPTTMAYENYNDIIAVLPPSPTTAGSMAYFIKDKALKAAVVAMGLEGYEPVGTTAWYIRSPANKYKLVGLDQQVRQQQLSVIENTINTDNFSSFITAHSTACGDGYMSGINPGLC